jgi:hypothetical protein
MYTTDLIDVDTSNILSYMKVSYNGISFDSDIKKLIRVKNKYINNGTAKLNDIIVLRNCFSETSLEKYFSIYLEKDQINSFLEQLKLNKG